MNQNTTVKVFYDNFKGKLLEDFLKPNIRIANAIRRSLLRIPCSTKSILDLGFGLGWSSYEFARHFPQAKIEAYDISKELYETARSLFQLPNLNYNNLDLTIEFPKGNYDVIILLDVFEHIPKAARTQFYNNISDALNPNGRVIMTCPTVDHQNYLRKNNPEGLQPVDEDVDLVILSEFSKNIQAEISLFENLNIWNPKDYLLAEISRYNDQSLENLQYLPSISLIDFYQKYELLKNSKELLPYLPKLTFKQKIKSILH
ncbi:class I SAM-dependent methyltransferase [Reichenbachiella ulvae]|uniref:Methyltransferase domain-containing protein n=1 Tax=Reichenbachiella ulvae TaxID=2980104 RepID=A0ABT3CYN8_9BACT|nr:class I SAM-dependent methyltransferase [Reichenbachiella ulvae]MCV9388812.1 methyltransferase domain-containing protein [Reichenbachiella ulvae]